MVSHSASDEILERLLQARPNQLCADCNSTSIQYASISHGSFICHNCAMAHDSLGRHISFIKPLEDKWTIRQLKLMTVGGNSILTSFFASYKIPALASVEFKYSTTCAKYYREMLRVMAAGETCTMPSPSTEDGIILITDPNGYGSSEFEAKGPGIAEMVGSAFSATLGAGKELFGKVKDNEAYKVFEGKASAAADHVGKGIKWGARKGKEQIEKGKGRIEQGASEGMRVIKSGAESALEQMTSGAERSYRKLQISDKAKLIKEETWGLLSNIEKNTIGAIRGKKEEIPVVDSDEELDVPLY